MTHRWLLFFYIAAIGLSAHAEDASAAEVFKWIDAAGTVHYSDTRPRDIESVETLRFEPTNAADYDPATDPYSILKQAERISDARAESALEARVHERTQPADGYEDWGYADYVDYVGPPYPAYATPLYLPPPRPDLRSARHAPNAARQQANAMQTLNVAERRPHSINSGTHRSRVLQSRELPLAPRR
jgi:hypothetical protein